jgi:hypothetical protein
MEVPQNDSGWNATVRPVAHNEPPQPTTSAARAPTATAQQPLTPPPILSYPPPPQRYAEDPRFKSPGRVPAAETLPPTTNRPAATATAMPLQSTTAPPAVACNPPATGNAAALPANAPTGEPTADGRQFSPEFVKQLTSLDIRLSQTVTTDRSEWQLDLLENEAEALRGEAQTVSEREAAKHVLSKIDRFANIQRRFERVATAAPPVATNPQPMMPVGPPPVAGPPIAYGGLPSGPLPPIDAPPGIQAVSPVPPLPEIPLAYGNNRRPIRPLLRTKPPETGSRRRFDAVGVLRPVRARRPGIPDYALVDDAGQVVTFVTPTPDIDPQPFVGQRVGISGPREYLQDLQKNHVTAGRISPVGDSFRR